MPARHPADKVHYIVQGLATYPFSDFGTGRSQNGSGRVNSIIDVWHSTLPSHFGAYSKENPVLLGREYLNWLFAVQEFTPKYVCQRIEKIKEFGTANEKGDRIKIFGVK
ncbi:UNVERIFIED_CONTAM: hypothetical protein Scaly_2979800 [Sesamum calycinum]|uniref:Uncharacterized protein n=1 Tax=Sesamum calycinum TaxID=2727403 RepID=A0AAW2KNF5_9LAMI